MGTAVKNIPEVMVHLEDCSATSHGKRYFNQGFRKESYG
jgi:hypothetical protein